MIDSPLLYLLSVALIASVFGIAERIEKTRFLFDYLPAVVLIYATAMVAAQLGVWEKTDALTAVYKTAKNNLLPAMLFLMLLSVDLRRFAQLGPRLIAAYTAATLSIMIAFLAVFLLFGFGKEEAGLFAALAGSWMGGTANMLAVGSAMHVGETMMGYALVVDAVCYTFWVMLLLAVVPLANRFARWSGATQTTSTHAELGCACTIGPRRYWLLLGSALIVALLSQWLGARLPWLGQATWSVLIATFLGVAGSYTPLARLNGAQELAGTMLLLLVALIGSRAQFAHFGEIPRYVAAGFAILALHGSLLLLAAKRFRLDLFAIGVASLANIGGVASAPILASAYHRTLVGVAVLMAVTGYLVGTFGGLAVGYALQWLAA
ncbi:DUF819 domain-containing protein [Hydrogenimonas urashimensis]|uniref:DUF819 family protein n=1 Tax=Hydrogenimonas urashimensis TaxID=2740515 RepID=UPI001915D0E7|nr:DUF819 family protein [Hydrogenimonas urashimensis]